ncbi:tropomyosin-1-like [Nicotiana tomentosiformis]|uniref:tropomyosin-1-like n=1 Tax=Nicotiana tomentosiformis TaxID=4098 RepID=UPI00388CA043
MAIDGAPYRTERISEKDSEKLPESLEIEDASHRSQQTALALHQEEFSKSWAELSRRETDFRGLSEERNALKLLSRQREEEIKDLRAELAKAHQDQTDLIEQRETLDEIHARGFDLTEEILKAKELEVDAGALASCDDESKSGSESGEEPDGEETAPGDNQKT